MAVNESISGDAAAVAPWRTGERALTAASVALVPALLLLDLALGGLFACVCWGSRRAGSGAGSQATNTGTGSIRGTRVHAAPPPAEVLIPASPVAASSGAPPPHTAFDVKGDVKQQQAATQIASEFKQAAVDPSPAASQSPIDLSRADVGWRVTHYRTWWRMVGPKVIFNTTVTFVLGWVMFHLGLLQGDWHHRPADSREPSDTPSSLAIVSVFFALSLYAFLVGTLPLFWWTLVYTDSERRRRIQAGMQHPSAFVRAWAFVQRLNMAWQALAGFDGPYYLLKQHAIEGLEVAIQLNSLVSLASTTDGWVWFVYAAVVSLNLIVTPLLALSRSTGLRRDAAVFFDVVSTLSSPAHPTSAMRAFLSC